MSAVVVPGEVRQHKVGTCPACGSGLWAEIAVETTVGNPMVDVNGKATAYATARVVAMRIEHSCDRRLEED